MRRTDSNIRERMTGLMRSVSALLQSAMRLMAVAVLLLVVSCSGGGDDPDSPGGGSPGGGSPGGGSPGTESSTPIVFSAQQQEGEDITRAGSRAVGLESVNCHSFKVWGYKNTSYSEPNYGSLQNVFPGYHVNWQENSANNTVANTNDWEYVNQQIFGEEHQTIKYWDWSAKAYRFFGTTGGSLSGTIVGDNYELSIPVDGTSITAIGDTPYFSTLWFSDGNTALTGEGHMPFGQPVQLVFMKPYSRVRFMFSYTYPREGVLVVNPSFAPTTGSEVIARKGTFTIIYPLTGSGTKESYRPTPDDSNSGVLTAFEEDYDGDSKTYTESINGWYTVLPNMNQGSFSLSVTVNGALKYCSVPREYMQWLPGYSYTYVFKINEQGGVAIDMVQTAFTKWTEVEGDTEVYNW